MTTSILLLALAGVEEARATDTAPAAESLTEADWLAEPAVAQDEEDDDPASEDDSVRSEREAVKAGKVDDAKGRDDEGDDEDRRRRIIKTIQKKNFIKVGRFEAGPSLGFVANDPFLNRYIVGGIFDYHLTEIFAAEVQFGYAPIFGTGGEEDPDWKPLSKQLLEENSVSPDISKLTAHGSAGFAYSPIYGKAAVGRSIIAFDIYGHFGLGFTATQDDLKALQKENEDSAIQTQNQVHPTTVYGGGARVAFNESLAVRLEGKAMSYVETVDSTTLEMKNNVIIQTNVSFFFPGMD
jgi:outer membrane beta-barrel protein